MIRRSGWVVAALWIAGCGGGGSASDAAAPDARADAGFSPATPAAPAPPVLVPCPAGWREVAGVDGAPTTCDPWPESGFADCAASDEVMFPGGGGCTRVGAACPAGDFADDLPTDRPIVYALAGAPAGGDGSLSRPYATISEATRAAAPAPGTVVAVGKGEYDELVSVPAGVVVWGACVAGTVLRFTGASAPIGLVSFLGVGGGVRNLRVAASPGPGIWVDGSRRDATVESVIVEATASSSIVASRGAHLTVRDVVVRDAPAHGFEIIEGASAELSRVLVERARDAALFVFSPGTTARLEDVALRETRPAPDGRGLTVEGGAAVDGARVVIERVAEGAVFVETAGSSVTLTDLVVREVATVRGGMYGRAVAVQAGARCEVRRARMEGLGDIALASFDAGSVLRLEDVVVRDVRGDDTGEFGRALGVQVGGSIELTRGWLEHLGDVGVFVADVTSTVSLSDLRMRDVQASVSQPTSGRGVNIQGGAQGTLARVVIEQTSESGITLVGSGTAADLQDVVVRRTRGTEDGLWGDGIMGTDGAALTGARIAIEDARRFGLLVGTGSSLSVTALVVRRTVEQACVVDGCAGAPGYGVGIASVGGSHATVADFLVDGAALCGVFVEGTAGLDLSHGEVRTAPVGACVTAADYDYARLSSDVAYYDVGRTLDTTSLPVPPLGSPLASF